MPEQVGPYTIVGELGRGGMAVVYLARQPALGRSVALKELAPFQAHDPLLAQRFIREARVAARLNHPNVVTVYDFLEQDGVAYIAMEYVDRGSLREQVGQLSLPQVAGVLEGLLAGLSHAESIGVAHRDIKPENLLVTADGGIKIADFGIAKAYQQVATEEMLTPAGATVGTPAYMAPEQAMGQEIGPWTDLYQTGVVAYELLGSGVPFRATGNPLAVMMMHISEPVPALPAGTDPALEQWVRALLAKDPSERPASARAAFNDLEEIIVGTLGPLWRRDARLGDRDPTVEHALTPASFSTWQDYVPGTPGRATTPPPPPPPARQDTPRPAQPQEPTLAPSEPPPAATVPPAGAPPTPVEPPRDVSPPAATAPRAWAPPPPGEPPRAVSPPTPTAPPPGPAKPPPDVSPPSATVPPLGVPPAPEPPQGTPPRDVSPSPGASPPGPTVAPLSAPQRPVEALSEAPPPTIPPAARPPEASPPGDAAGRRGLVLGGGLLGLVVGLL
jgi:serine/threonine protein kinase